MREDRRRAGMGLLAAAAVSLLAGIAVYQVMGFTYTIADDIIMRDIASGAFTGKPDGHLIFIRYAMGFCISRLYLLNGSVDWYGFFIAGSLFLGLAAVLYRGLAADKSLLWKAVYTAFSLCLFGIAVLYHAACFEWTISAAVLGGSALYLYAAPFEKAGIGKLVDHVLIWVLLILTFGIRYDVFFMVLPGFGAVFLWRFFEWKEKNFRIRLRELILPAAVFLSVGLVALIEGLVYRSPEWKEYQEFNMARSEVYDYSGVLLYEENPGFFDELGLDEHDVRNLRHYALYFVEGMDTEMMERISQEAWRQTFGGKGKKERIWDGICLVAKEMTSPKYFSVSIPFLGFLFCALVLAFRRQKGLLLLLALFLGIEGVLWLYLGVRGRLPERVVFSMYLVMLLAAAGLFYRLYQAEERESKNSSGKQKRLLLTGALAVCFAGAVFQCRTALRDSSKEPSNYQLFKDGCKNDTDRIYFIESFIAEPLGGAVVTTHGDFRMNRCLTLGDWYSFSPIDRERFEVYGMEDVEEAILNDPNVYLVLRDTEDTGFYGTYFAHKYPDVKLVRRDKRVIDGRDYYLYQAQR